MRTWCVDMVYGLEQQIIVTLINDHIASAICQNEQTSYCVKTETVTSYIDKYVDKSKLPTTHDIQCFSYPVRMRMTKSSVE